MNHPTLSNLLNYKRLQAIVKNTIKKKKVNSWKEFTSTLNSNTPSAKVWRVIKSINGAKVNLNFPIANEESNEIKSNLLLNHFTRDLLTENIGPPIENYLVAPVCNHLFTEITRSEISKCIKKTKNTAPGSDSICNIFLKKAPLNIIEELHTLFNSSLKSGLVPEEWKKSIVCPIPKPGRDPTLVTSYRQISMLSCMGKLMERIIKQRLEYFLECNNVFPATQAGFRKCRSTIDILAILKHRITQSRNKDKVCLVTYLDLDSAYESVNLAGLLKKLSRLRVDPYIEMLSLIHI